MTIPEALDKAVEEGYHIYGSKGMDTDYEGATNDYAAWTKWECLLVTLYQGGGTVRASIQLSERVMAERIETKALVYQLAGRM